MPLLGYFDLILHYGQKIRKIANVDPDRYCYLDLVDDALNRLMSFKASEGVAIEMQYKVPGMALRRNISSDIDILQMFEDCGLVTQIQIYVYAIPTKPLSVDYNSSTAGGCKQTLGGKSGNCAVEVDNSSQYEIGSDLIGSGSDGVSDSDGEWMGEKEDSDSSDKDIDELGSEGGSDTTNDRLSNFDEEHNTMGDDKDGDSNRDEVYVDRGMVGTPFVRQPNGKVALAQGLLFADVHEFRAVLRDFVIQEGFEIVRIKNEKARVTVMCAAKGCTWRIHASPTPDGKTYKIKTYNPIHCCIRNTKNTNATAAWIAKKLYNKLREDPNMTYASMKSELREQYGLEVPQMQLYRAKKKVSEDNKHFHAKSYTRLPIWCDLLKNSNPGSAAELVFDIPRINANPMFKRLFLCFDAMKKGFVKGCRPWVGIDGCHLKGPFGGILLSAVALDGNKGMFPLAIAMVESESKDTWMFFLHNLHEVLCSVPEFRVFENLTIMSDQQKGLDQAVAAAMPYARHRICCNHLLNNFKQRFPAMMLRPLFWMAAKASNHFLFEKAMDRMLDADPDAAKWLLSKPLSAWAMHTSDPAIKSIHVTNNASECFNNWLADDRKKTILSMAESIRCRLMGKLYERYEKASTWDHSISPRIRADIDKIMQDSRGCNVTCAGDDEYQVRDGFTPFVVNLRAMTCGCKYWNLSGLPCKHACAAISHKRAEVERYCHAYYTRETYLLAYAEIIHPMPDLEEFIAEQVGGEKSCRPIDPPNLRRGRGRPKNNRRRSSDEPLSGVGEARRSSTVKCANCNQFGHNKRTCRGGPIKQKGKKRAEAATDCYSSQASTLKGKKGKVAAASGSHTFSTQVHVEARSTPTIEDIEGTFTQASAVASSTFQGSQNASVVTRMHANSEATIHQSGQKFHAEAAVIINPGLHIDYDNDEGAAF